MFRRCFALGMLGAFALMPRWAGAQQVRSPAPAADTSSARVDPRSPRATVADFLALTRRGQFDAAARYLGSAGAPGRGADLARRLKAVFDQHLPLDLDLVSPLAAGDTLDRLRADREQIGAIRTESGVLQSVQLQRMRPNEEPAWVFAPSTVERVDEWYDALGDHWLRDRMPLALQQPGPLGIDRWQWLTLALLIPLAIGLGWFAGRLTVAVARRAVRRTQTTLDDRLLKHTGAPLLALWGVLAYRGLVEVVGLSITAEWMVGLGVRAASVGITTWLIVRATYVLEDELPALPLAGQRPEIRSFAPLIGRVTRIFVIAFGSIAIVAQFGYSVTALLTGVGIGGIALALAAQKTLEHAFGSVAIGIDQPIRVGDWVKIGDVEGEVEAIGLRSTRVRTLARTLVVFPNGRLADTQMENFGVRDRILLRARLGLTYNTSADQMRRVRDEIEHLLAEHPLVWPGHIIVRFRGFGASSLDIDVIAWIASTDYDIFRAAREEIFLKFLEIVEGAGCAFAYPTQTVMLENMSARAEENMSGRS